MYFFNIYVLKKLMIVIYRRAVKKKMWHCNGHSNRLVKTKVAGRARSWALKKIENDLVRPIFVTTTTSKSVVFAELA